MAAGATEILSLEDAKREFQVESSDVSEDSRVGDIIHQAVALVARLSGLPLVDRDSDVQVYLAGMHDPILLPQHVKSINSVKYWENEDEFRLAPTHTLSATLGRFQPVEFEGTGLYPPADGWPRAYLDMLLVDVKIGYDLDGTNKDIRTAVILVARQIYLGHPDVSVPQYLLYNMGSFGA